MKTHKERVLWVALSGEQQQSIFDSYEDAQEQQGINELTFEDYVYYNINLWACLHDIME